MTSEWKQTATNRRKHFRITAALTAPPDRIRPPICSSECLPVWCGSLEHWGIRRSPHL